MINTLTLSFPNGIEMKTAQEIAIQAEKISGHGISEGGFKMLTNIYMMTPDDPLEFDEHHAHFVHSYVREKSI